MSLGHKILAKYMEGEGKDPAVQKAALLDAKMVEEMPVSPQEMARHYASQIRFTVDPATRTIYIHTTTGLARMAEDAFRKSVGMRSRTTKDTREH